MLQKLIHRLLKRRHFWRHVGFAELAELYSSRMLRLLALHMVTVLIAVYLYQSGYSLVFIGWYFAAYFGLRIVCAAPAAWLVARVGPKHGMFLGNILYIPALALLAFLIPGGVLVLVPAIVFKAMSATLYDVAYYVDFSKVKHADHAGKELGFMQIVEKIATGLSPLFGGLVAFWLGPQMAIFIAAMLFALAALPLFLTAEPVPLRQRIHLHGINIRRVWRNFMAEAAGGLNYEVTTGSAWSLFIVIAVLGTHTDAVYAQLGALTAVTLLASFITASIFGKLIDRNKGGQLLQISVFAQSLLHLVRPFIQTPSGVAGLNISSEMATTGLKMPFIRGMFDEADRTAGYRVVYLTLMMVSLCVGGMLLNMAMALFAMALDEADALRVLFFIAAAVSLLIGLHGFSMYRR